MKVEDVFLMLEVDDCAEIIIWEDYCIIAHGNWYQDDVLQYLNYMVESFTWQNGYSIYISIKGE